MKLKIKQKHHKKTSGERKHRRAYTLAEIAIVFAVTGFIMSSIWYAASAANDARKSAQAIDQIRYVIDKVHDLEIVNPSILTVKNDPGCTVGSRLCGVPACGKPPPGPPPATVCGPAPACTLVSGPGPCTPPPTCVNGSETLSDTVYNNLDTTGGLAAGLFPSEMVSGTSISSPWGKGDTALTITQTTNGCALNSALATSVYGGLTPGMAVNIQGMGGYVAPGPNNYSTPTSVTLTISDVPKAACIRLLSDYGVELLNMGMTEACTSTSGGCSYGDENLTPAKAADFTTSDATYWCQSPGSAKVYMTFVFTTQTPN